MMAYRALAAALLFVLAAPAIADEVSGGRWYRAPAAQKRAEVARILGNIDTKPGCRIKLSVDYYVRALNAMLAEDTYARNLQLHEALALIGTVAEGDWCPGR